MFEFILFIALIISSLTYTIMQSKLFIIDFKIWRIINYLMFYLLLISIIFDIFYYH